jgi:hypothetical protein
VTVAGPQKYELECRQCGFRFVLERNPMVRTADCPICGEHLTVAWPVPVPPPPPPAPPKPAPVPVKYTPLPLPARDWSEPDEPDPSADDSPTKWLAVRAALDRTRFAAQFATVLLAVLVLVDLVSFVLLNRAEQLLGSGAASCLVIVQILPVVIHLSGQVTCARLPGADGGRLARMSLWLLGVAVVAPCWCCALKPGGVAVGVLVVLVLGSFGMWLVFLAYLGVRLSARSLASAARVFRVWYMFGTILCAALLGMAYVASEDRVTTAAGCFQFGAILVGFFLLSRYVALLHIADRVLASYGHGRPRR